MKLKELQSLIRELIRNEVKEMSTSGNVGAYATPFAFGNSKKKKKGYMGYKEIK
jgi:hypothetical protein